MADFDIIGPIFIMFSRILHRCLPTSYYKLNIFYEGLPMSDLFAPFLLVLALSADIFAASFSYGTDHVTIPLVSRILIAGISTVVLCIALIIGGLFRPLSSHDRRESTRRRDPLLPRNPSASHRSCGKSRKGVQPDGAAAFIHERGHCPRLYPRHRQRRRRGQRRAFRLLRPDSLEFSLFLGLLAIQGGLTIGKLASRKTHLDFSKSSGILLLVLGVSCLL